MSTWVVDTCVLLDLVAGSDAQANAAETILEDAATEGLCICPVTLVELAPSFPEVHKLRDFLLDYAIDGNVGFASLDAEAAHLLWQRLIQRRRLTGSPRRPLADVLIAGFARCRRGLITRNSTDFAVIAPELPLWIPGNSRPR